MRKSQHTVHYRPVIKGDLSTSPWPMRESGFYDLESDSKCFVPNLYDSSRFFWEPSNTNTESIASSVSRWSTVDKVSYTFKVSLNRTRTGS